MAISIPQGYMVTAPEPIDHRLVLTKRQMRLLSRDEGQLPEKYFCLCAEKELDGLYHFYVFDKRNTWTEETGKYRLAGEASEGLDYNTLINKPRIGGSELVGDLTPEQLGLQRLFRTSEGVQLLNGFLSVLVDKVTVDFNDKGELVAKISTSELEDALATEIARAKTSEGMLMDALLVEIARAMGSEQNLEDALAAEIARAKSSEGNLLTLINEERARAITSEGQLRDTKQNVLVASEGIYIVNDKI